MAFRVSNIDLAPAISEEQKEILSVPGSVSLIIL